MRHVVVKEDMNTCHRLNPIADELDKLQSLENEGRGVQCVRQMITYLRAGDFGSAWSTYQTDGDKTRQYPELERALRTHFGCRRHGGVGTCGCNDETI